MQMKYTQVEVSRDLIRDEVLRYLRENQRTLMLSEPATAVPNAARHWFDATQKVGKSMNELTEEVYRRLISSGEARLTDVAVLDSSIMSAYNAYFPVKVKTKILEEIVQLVRIGVLIPVGYAAKRPGVNYEFDFDFGSGLLLLTEYGVRYLAEGARLPFFAEEYVSRLRQTAEPDDELKGYLSEGLACVRNHLGRAAAILLRLAAEHTLDKLVRSIMASIAQDKERKSFERGIRTAGLRIEERAEVVFRKLESSTVLVPDSKHFRNMVRNRLRSAFHSIRDLGGRAAHLGDTIELEEVIDHYALYASSVYPIAMKIIEHQRTL